MHEIKHPEYIPVHIILILGAFFMLFPFVWMISASFKSNSEIIKSPTDKIVLLPDSIRPSFLNDESDRKRIQEQKELDDAWYAKPENERDPRKKPFEWWDNYKNALKLISNEFIEKRNEAYKEYSRWNEFIIHLNKNNQN